MALLIITTDLANPSRSIAPGAGFAREAAVLKGIVINGLAILTDDGILDVHYRDHVIGGPGAFVLGIETFAEFKNAILAKLIREVADLPADLAPTPKQLAETLLSKPTPDLSGEGRVGAER